MIKVTVLNNGERKKLSVAGSTIIDPNGAQSTMPAAVTPRNLLDASGIDYARLAVNMDGYALSPMDLDKPLSMLGVTDGDHTLSLVYKADNAAI